MNRAAFTLIELLLVVFLLTLVALSATTTVGAADDQLRYEDTQNRLALIRRAILGQPHDLRANGLPIVSGFLADMGHLPTSVTELLELGALPPYEFDADPNVEASAGWRGPYLQTLPSSSNTLRFLDGWGTAFDWTLTDDTDTDDVLTITSLGGDGVPNGSDYDADFPTAPLITGTDHLVDLVGWTPTLNFNTLPNSDLRLRLLHPQNGTFDWVENETNDWATTASVDLDAEPHLSLSITPPTTATTPTTPITFDFGPDSKLVPFGTHRLQVLDDSNGAVLHSLPLTLLPRTDPPTGPWTLP